MNPRLMMQVRSLSKTFRLHHQAGIELPVLQAISFDAYAGECLVLSGPSGAGKSTLLRCLYGNYLASSGSIQVRDKGQWTALSGASEQLILRLRREAIGYVSQFLRVIPRVSALDVVAEPLRMSGIAAEEARARAASLLQRLNIPSRLFELPPGSFSGGEQQRVNIARGLIGGQPILLLDEPTASLDAENRQMVVALIQEALLAGRCVIGIFHDEAVKDALAKRAVQLQPTAIVNTEGATTCPAST